MNTLHTHIDYTLHTTHYTLHTTHYTLHTTHHTPHTTHHTPHTTHHTQHTTHNTTHTTHNTTPHHTPHTQVFQSWWSQTKRYSHIKAKICLDNLTSGLCWHCLSWLMGLCTHVTTLSTQSICVFWCLSPLLGTRRRRRRFVQTPIYSMTILLVNMKYN